MASCAPGPCGCSRLCQAPPPGRARVSQDALLPGPQNLGLQGHLRPGPRYGHPRLMQMRGGRGLAAPGASLAHPDRRV